MESTTGVLEPSVTVEERMCIGVCLHSQLEGLEYQRIVIPVADGIGHDALVEEVQNSAEIELVHRHACIPFELTYIGQPFFIGLVGMKLTVQNVLGHNLRLG